MSSRFSFVTPGVGSCSLDFPQVGWCTLVFVEDSANFLGFPSTGG